MEKIPGGDTSWFVHDRFGMAIHWGTYALAARHEWVQSQERIPTDKYRTYFDHFYPDLYEPREWARMAREAGMKYFVITAKHHEGFCLWDTKFTDYKASNTPWGKDVLTPMVDAFRAEGIRVGLYYSLVDWNHADFTVDRIHPMRDNKDERAKNPQRDIRKYAEYMRNQVQELLTQFGKIDILWFDFSYPGEDGKGRDDWESEQLYALIRDLAPQVIIDSRLDLPGAGDFVAPEQFQPSECPKNDKEEPVVWEALHTFSGSWGYHRDELTWKSVPQLLGMLIDGVSKGGNLLLNVGPTGRGEFDHRAQERLAGIGAWMRQHSRSIYGCGAAPKELTPPPDCRYTYNKETNRLYLHIMAWPFVHIHCTGLAGRVEYAQMLHDASEVQMKGLENWQKQAAWKTSDNVLWLSLPVLKPNVDIPVIELFLKK